MTAGDMTLEQRLRSGALVSAAAIEHYLSTHAGPRTINELEAASTVNRSTIWRICQDGANPKPDTVILLAEALDCEPLDLLAKTENEARIEQLEAELARLRT